MSIEWLSIPIFVFLLVGQWYRYVRQQKKQLSALLKCSDALVRIDQQGKVQAYNHAAVHLFPQLQAAEKDYYLADVFTFRAQQEFFDWLKKTLRSGTGKTQLLACNSQQRMKYCRLSLYYHPFNAYVQPIPHEIKLMQWLRQLERLLFRTRSTEMLLMLQDVMHLQDHESLAIHPLAQHMLHHTPLGVIHCRSGKIIHINPSAMKIIGVENEQLLLNSDFSLRLTTDYRQIYATAEQSLLQGQPFSPMEVELIRANGDCLWVELMASCIILGSDETTVQILLHDVHGRKQDEEHLTWLSCYDSLTELPNRRLFADRMQQALALAHREQQSLSLIYFDLDRFKYVNDSLGHAVGDEVLRMAAQRLRQLLRESDSPARLGGDEFAALLPHTGATAGQTVAEKLLFSLRQPYRIETRELTLGASIGIAVYPDHGEDQETLLRRADAAMYYAKQHRCGIYFFAAEMEERNKRSMLLEQELARSGMQHEFSVYYQGQYAVQNDHASSSLIGLEALLRWRHPRLGLISPDEFIPLAEETGQIGHIVYWVVEQCARHAVAWERKNIRPEKIAINLSSTQLMQVGVAAELIGRIIAANARPEWFELEITETAMMRDPETAIQIMEELVATGISIAMDDYGTGYSSLTYIKRLPIRKIKIDRSFIQLLPEDEEDSAIVRSTIAMGHALGKFLLAEGVENSEQLLFLQRAGCDAVQGFLFNRPMEHDIMTQYLYRLSNQSALTGQS